MPERTIIHLNIADFAVAVERLCDSRLRGRPVIIANKNAQRATVYDMSDEAYQDGIRKGMPLHTARRFCRTATVVEPHPDRYQRAMDALSKLATPYTPLLEAAADDGHLFLDVTGTHRLFGPAMDIAWRLEKTVRKDMALRPIWTVAPNKLVAKVASRIVKPVGEYIVGTGEEVSFLAPRPLTLLPGIEQPDIRQFSELNISRVGEVAALSLQQLFMFCGNRAHYLHELAHGIDPSPVLPRSLQQPALRFSHIFSGITNDKKVILRAVYQLAEHIGAALRSRCLGTRRLGITLCYTDGLQTSRQASINQATAIDSILFHFAKIALYRAWHRRTRLQSICLSGDRLVPPSPQMEIFPAARAIREKKGNLCNALDIIRHRYSHTTILPGRLLAT